MGVGCGDGGRWWMGVRCGRGEWGVVMGGGGE